MPFTVSHVAAVLPFHRPLSRLRVYTAAVIGSMVPDFGLLSPIPLTRLQTHSIPALLTFCLPVGLISYWLTQLLIRPAIREAMPDRAYVRLPSDELSKSVQGWQHWLLAALAILFGALTHLAWDLFTHEDSRGTRWFPVLTDYGPEMAGHSLPITRWLQYGSSGFGLLIVMLATALWLWHARRPQPPPARRLTAGERAVWMSFYILVPLAAMAVHFVHGVPRSNLNDFARRSVIDGMRATVVTLVLVSALLRLRLRAPASDR